MTLPLVTIHPALVAAAVIVVALALLGAERVVRAARDRLRTRRYEREVRAVWNAYRPLPLVAAPAATVSVHIDDALAAQIRGMVRAELAAIEADEHAAASAHV